MKVSVCITTYNLEKYIEQTLDSVLNQKTNFDYEVIISDDNSTDNTRNILLKYKNIYPHKIILNFQKRNVGVNKNNYDLIMLSKGEYIAWCDGDDYWIDEYKLEKQVKILDSNPQYSCVHTLWRDFYEDRNTYHDVIFKQYNWEKSLKGKKHVEYLLEGKTTSVRFSSLMLRKSIIFNSLQEDPTILTTINHVQNDFAIMTLLLNEAPSFLMEDITTVYRIRKESLSQTESKIKRYKYIYLGLNLTVYILKKYKLKNIAQKKLHSTVSSLLLFIYKNPENINDFTCINSLLSTMSYKYSLGQTLIIKSFKYKGLRFILDIVLKD